MSDLKRCPGCKQEKCINRFTKNKRKKDGLSSYCKQCEKEQRLVKKNKPKIIPNSKVCSNCNLEKDSCEFHLNNLSTDGLYSYCKKCKRELYYTPNPKPVRVFIEKGTKICTKCEVEKPLIEFTKNKTLPFCVEYQCKECKRVYRETNKEAIKVYKDRWVKGNIEKIREKGRNNYHINKESYKEYREKNKESIRKNKREYFRERVKVDLLFKLTNRIRNLVRVSINNFKDGSIKKSNTTSEILECSLEEFFYHIESQFSKWMTWDNYGKYDGEYKRGWDLDHIVPVSSATTEEELLKLNHWSNFQPLCSKVNRYEKGNNLYPVTNLELNETFLP